MIIEFPDADFKMFEDDAKKKYMEYFENHAASMKEKAELLAYDKYEKRDRAMVTKKTMETAIDTYGHYVPPLSRNKWIALIIPMAITIFGIFGGALLGVSLGDKGKTWHLIVAICILFLIIIGYIIIYFKSKESK